MQDMKHAILGIQKQQQKKVWGENKECELEVKLLVGHLNVDGHIFSQVDVNFSLSHRLYLVYSAEPQMWFYTGSAL